MNSNFRDAGLPKKDGLAFEVPFLISNISIKPPELENCIEQTGLKNKKPKYLPPTKPGYHSQAESRNANTKMLPGISIKNISPDDKNMLEFKHRFKG